MKIYVVEKCFAYYYDYEFHGTDSSIPCVCKSFESAYNYIKNNYVIKEEASKPHEWIFDVEELEAEIPLDPETEDLFISIYEFELSD